MPAGETLVVLATDPEAHIDLAALAADEGHAFAHERLGEEWRITLTKVPPAGSVAVDGTRLDNRT